MYAQFVDGDGESTSVLTIFSSGTFTAQDTVYTNTLDLGTSESNVDFSNLVAMQVTLQAGSRTRILGGNVVVSHNGCVVYVDDKPADQKLTIKNQGKGAKDTLDLGLIGEFLLTTFNPTTVPTFPPTFPAPTFSPTFLTAAPTSSPTAAPSSSPTATPTYAPTAAPTFATATPTYAPTNCGDVESFTANNGKTRECPWVASTSQCDRYGEQCPVTCGLCATYTPTVFSTTPSSPTLSP